MHARYYHAGLARFISADTIVPQPGNPQDLNRYSYVRNSPLNFTDPSGHLLDSGGDGRWSLHRPLPLLPVKSGNEPTPWYAPGVIAAAKAWWWADSNIGGFGRYLEADRITMPVQLGLKGNPLSYEGLNLCFDSPLVTSNWNLRFKARVDWGSPRLPRVDQGGLTVRQGKLSEIYGSWQGDEYGVAVKSPANSRDLGGGFEISTISKGVVGVGWGPPLNPYVTTESVGEFAFSGPFAGSRLTVKAEPALTGRHTFHGGTAALVAAPVAVYFGGLDLVAALAGSGAAKQVLELGY